MPAKNAATTVTLTARANPTSLLADWITNRLLIDSPFQTMKELRPRVQLEKYLQAESDFITELNYRPDRTIRNASDSSHSG
ncbi:MAG: hypothetical protein HQ498_01720 [Pseudohongiella sp.]|nr:hypothetical protein [Pseudohongiella sp.]